MRLYYFLFILWCVATTQTSIAPSLREDVLTFLKRSIDIYDEKTLKPRPKQRDFNSFHHGRPRLAQIDARAAKDKAKVIKNARTDESRLNFGKKSQHPKHSISPLAQGRYHMDPVLNFMKRRSGADLRRSRRKKKVVDSSEDMTSSSIELGNWKEQWEEQWIKKKFEAINSSKPRGDVVNMVAARPWGTPCGDPNQHDMPWGTCMLPMECDAEYRIYRGDYFCGRTNFVCCALQYTNYDMYQGFDVSFDDTSFSTDSDEKKSFDNKGNDKKKRERERKNRNRIRVNRKRTIKRLIRKIVKEIQKLLGKVYRNGTHARKKKTKLLKQYILDLKKKYRKERKAVKAIHDLEIIKIDAALKRRLEQIRAMNKNFVMNSTFRDIVVNGTINKKGARMLVQAYPELEQYVDPRLIMRRSGGGEVHYNRYKPKPKPKDYLEYDIEYGLLYS